MFKTRWKKTLLVREAAFGLGVFARRAIRAGEIIGLVNGEILDDPDHSSAYCIDLGGSYSLEPGEPFRFLNHSCTPNCRLLVVDDDVPRRRTVEVEALADIAPTAELTIDYAWPADVAIPCGCGSANCRGWIVCPADLPKVIRARGPAPAAVAAAIAD